MLRRQSVQGLTTTRHDHPGDGIRAVALAQQHCQRRKVDSGPVASAAFEGRRITAACSFQVTSPLGAGRVQAEILVCARQHAERLVVQMPFEPQGLEHAIGLVGIPAARQREALQLAQLQVGTAFLQALDDHFEAGQRRPDLDERPGQPTING